MIRTALKGKMDKTRLTRRLTSVLTRAYELGRTQATLHIPASKRERLEEAGPLSLFSGLASRVKDIVNTLTAYSAAMTDGDDPDAYAAMVGANEVHSAVQQGAVDLYNDYGLPIVWLAENDACPICTKNADAGAITAGNEFPSGHTEPPVHLNCRCSIDYAA